ncbi:MAG: hypothetical protein VKJ46_02880 [Leptolyngbyaceae bacterium]|nr:hypothetical protein [Leptolyngbyaceae bacterium]
MSQDVMSKILPDTEPSLSGSESVLSLSEISPNFTEEALALPLWSMDAYADSLMDELFEEVDQILDGAVRLPTEPTPAAMPKVIQALTVPPINLPQALLSPQTLYLKQQDAALSTFVANTTGEHESSKRTFFVDRFLLGVACASCLLSGALWLSSAGWLDRWAALIPSASVQQPAEVVAKVDPKEQAETQFINYIQRSLEAIDQSPTGKTVTVASNVPTSTANLPTVPVAGNSSPTPKPIAPVLERVYIPVYQPPQGLYPPQGMPPSIPQPMALQVNPETVATPGGVNNSIMPVPAPAPAPVAVTTSVVPTPSHTLVGILELGKRSTALFEINGSAQRVNLGEEVGSSGWVLVKIANQEAMLRRNGTVRSIFVGQKF